MALSPETEIASFGGLAALGINPSKLLLKFEPGKKEFSTCLCWVEDWVEKPGDKPKSTFVPISQLFQARAQQLVKNVFEKDKNVIDVNLEVALLNIAIYELTELVKNYQPPTNDILDAVLKVNEVTELEAQAKLRKKLLDDSSQAAEVLKEQFNVPMAFKRTITREQDGAIESSDETFHKTKRDIILESVKKFLSVASEVTKDIESNLEIAGFVSKVASNEQRSTQDLLKSLQNLADSSLQAIEAAERTGYSGKIMAQLSKREDLNEAGRKAADKAAETIANKVEMVVFIHNKGKIETQKNEKLFEILKYISELPGNITKNIERHEYVHGIIKHLKPKNDLSSDQIKELKRYEDFFETESTLPTLEEGSLETLSSLTLVKRLEYYSEMNSIKIVENRVHIEKIQEILKKRENLPSNLKADIIKFQLILERLKELPKYATVKSPLVNTIKGKHESEPKPTDELVDILVHISDFPLEMQLNAKKFNYPQDIMKILKDRKDLTLSQLTKVLDAAKKIDGKIGTEGVNLILNQVQMFSRKAVIAIGDRSRVEMVRLKQDLVGALKKDEQGERGLLKHLSKRIRSRVKKFFAKLGRILTFREAEYQERKGRRIAAERGLLSLEKRLERHLVEKPKPAQAAAASVPVRPEKAESMEDVIKAMDEFIQELDKILKLHQQAAAQAEPALQEDAAKGAQKSELDLLIEELENEVESDLEVEEELLPFNLEAPSYDYAQRWLALEADYPPKLGEILAGAIKDFEAEHAKGEKKPDYAMTTEKQGAKSLRFPSKQPEEEMLEKPEQPKKKPHP